MAERGNIWQRRLDYYCGIPLATLTALLRLRCQRSLPTAPQRVGFLCLGAIGDLLLFSALITALRQRLPQARFFLLTSRANAQAAQLLPGIDESAAFGVRQLAAMSAWLRARRLDILLDSTQWARLGTVLCNLSGAGCTVGFATPGQYRSAGYTFTVAHSKDRHEVENFLALGRVLFPHLTGLPQLTLPPSPEVAPQLLAEVRASGRPVYLHMWPAGLHAELKEWPASSWANLARELHRQGLRVYLTGSSGDAARTAAFLQAFPHCGARSLAGKVSLRGLAGLFAEAAGVVSVNTGTMHLAALVGAPTVGLHGPTNPRRWGPVGAHVRALLPRTGHCAYLNLGFEYVKPYVPCLAGLPVADVLDALAELHVVSAHRA
ncbi:MAG: glycosyltransferase family 9 protein [Desulfovibrio sp.]|nr:glycosyltransferase family 9 protein [Desulfovibrio sp.]